MVAAKIKQEKKIRKLENKSRTKGESQVSLIQELQIRGTAAENALPSITSG